jgi:cobalamin biosynthesis protein CobT
LDSAEAEWQYCVDILQDVFQLPASDIEQMANGTGDTDDSGDGGDGSEPVKGKRRDYIVTVKYDEMLGQREHDADQKALNGIHIDYDNYSESQYDPHTAETTRIGMAEDIIRSAPCPYESSNIVRRVNEVESTGLANRARRFLQAETRKSYSCNQRAGKLDTRKLTRLVTHDRDSSLVPAIFKQTAQKRAINTCVSILVDASGSMAGGGKYSLAVAAAWGMIEVCETLRIPCEVAAFTEQDPYSNFHLLYKEFSKKVTRETFIERAGKGATVMSSNADSDNILVAYNRILQRNEEKKLIIVMSDGSPASYRGECMTYTKKVVKTIEQAHHVDIMGVGILDENVKLIYGNNQVINHAADIPESLIEILKTNVTLNK